MNAGSGSNQSNHMYKLGPIHQGTLERGAKTTSDSYILWPARVGAFSLVMGILGAEAGLLGYNGVLCAIALGTASLKGFGEATAAVLLSTVLQIAGMRIGITTLTAPFVLATWTVVLLRKVW